MSVISTGYLILDESGKPRSIATSELGVIKYTLSGGDIETDSRWREHHRWTLSLSSDGKRARISYRTGLGIHGTPDPLDVLYCAFSDARAGTDSFEAFADEFGYDQDSRSSYATWEACRAQGERLLRIFGSSYDAWDDALALREEGA